MLLLPFSVDNVLCWSRHRPAYTLITTDLVEATGTCLIANVEESLSSNKSEVAAERQLLEEFSRCLLQVISAANGQSAVTPSLGQ